MYRSVYYTEVCADRYVQCQVLIGMYRSIYTEVCTQACTDQYGQIMYSLFLLVSVDNRIKVVYLHIDDDDFLRTCARSWWAFKFRRVLKRLSQTAHW